MNEAISPSRTQLFGSILTVCVAISFAINTSLASVAYEYGANPLSALTYRTTLAAITLGLILKLWRVEMNLPRRVKLIAMGMGLILASYSYGLLGAIQYIPVGLAVVTFYLYPILTGLGAWAMGQEKLTGRLITALVLAFIGLAFALDVIGLSLDLIGIAMATAAALLFATMLVLMNRLIRGQDSRPVSFYMLCSGALVYIVMDLIAGEFHLPEGSTGWTVFLSTGVFYSFAIIGMFVAVSKIGAVKAGLLMNFEPLASLIIGVVFLGQILTPWQFFGVALVLVAIVYTALGRKAEDSEN